MKRNRKIGTAQAALVCTTQTTVRFSEVDSMQVVWHGEYVRYFEDGREAFGRQYPGLGYMDFYGNGYTAPIVDLQLQYVSPLTVNDVAVIETRYIDTAAAKLCFEYVIHRQSDGALIARGSSVQVFVDSNGEMCLNTPAFFEQWKERWLNRE
ncbi:MAG: acyl-CoA thioesterase [Alistipes sp.]|nr:acyl-CoA thioesterase [Alistipes sp.]